MSYHISKTVDLDFDEAVSRTIEELAKEGFGVLTDIDFKTVLKEKLDVDFKRYRVLGACNPPPCLRDTQGRGQGGHDASM